MKFSNLKFCIFLIFVAWNACSCRHGDPGDESQTLGVQTDSFVISGLHTKVGVGSGSGYTAVSVPFAPVDALRKQIESKFHETLKTRGEAHITAITPPEYKALNAVLSGADIAKGLPTNDPNQFRVVCLGRGELTSGKAMRAYFIVVNDSQIVQYRSAVFDRYVKAGGSKAAFDPKAAFTHITVGFTDRDLHIEDGVVKDQSSCVAGLTEK